MKLTLSLILISLIQKARSLSEPAIKTVGVGVECNYALSILCEDGLLCSINGVLPDAPHYCTKPNSLKEGEKCNSVYSTECQEGLLCTKIGPAPDAVSVCKKPTAAKEGEKCDITRGVECDSQLLCAKDGSKSIEGICEKPKNVAKDQVCNGYTILCESGFTCAKNEAATDGTRICKETAPKTVKEGETCGGKIDVTMNFPTVCETGLKCSNDPATPDIPGVCLKYVGEGEGCGGLLATAPRCESGLSCVASATASDLPGLCKKVDTATPPPPLLDVVGVGKSCGNIHGILKNCESGLKCVTGVCEDHTATQTIAPPSKTATQYFPVDATGTLNRPPPKSSDDVVNSANTLSSLGFVELIALLLF